MKKQLLAIITALLFLLHDNTFAQQHDDFIIVTPEKTGTHLLIKAVENILDKNVHNIWTQNISRRDLIYALNWTKDRKQILHLHTVPSWQTIYTLKEKNYKVLFLIRDPRDQAISMLFFIRNQKWALGPLDISLPFGFLSFEDQLDELISGARYGFSGIRNLTGNHLTWFFQDPSFVYSARFENLVGNQGGGSRARQLDELRNITDFINYTITDHDLGHKTQNLYGKPGEGTFRKGKIGEWKKYFLPHHKELFKEFFGLEIIQMGYENDFNW